MEGTALVVDCEGGDLLDELEEVNGRVEERGLEFAFQVDVGVFGFGALHVLRYVDERGDVDGELREHRQDDVRVEDVVLRAFLGELLDRLEYLRQ